MEIRKNQREVESKTEAGKTYIVTLRTDGTFHCTCPAFQWRTEECKHIKEVKDGQTLHPVVIHALKEHGAGKTGFTVFVHGFDEITTITIGDKSYRRYVVAHEPLFKIDAYGFVFDVNTLISFNNAGNFGGWTNKDGNMEVERVTLFDNLDEAMRHAKEYEQEYIFDLYKGVNIPVNNIPALTTLQEERDAIINNLTWLEYYYGDSDGIPDSVMIEWANQVTELKKMNRRIALLEHQQITG